MSMDLTQEALCDDKTCDFCRVADHEDVEEYGLRYWFTSLMSDVCCVADAASIVNDFRALLKVDSCKEMWGADNECCCLFCAPTLVKDEETLWDFVMIAVGAICATAERPEILRAWRAVMGYQQCKNAED